MAPRDQMDDLKMDASQLYREEVFTDRAVGTIRRMTPVDREGNTDPGRSVDYIGQTQVLTPAGALPLSFEIDADSLEAAVAGFDKAAREALERTARELEEMRREAASSIVVPGMDGPGGPGGLPGGGLPGGGRIKMR